MTPTERVTVAVRAAMLAATIMLAVACTHEVIENGPPPYASITHGEPIPTPTPVTH